MSNIVLALGPIVFSDFELPTGISFGGRQQLAVHDLADGRRVIDCVGRRDADIEFAGTLSGPDAGLRARELDRLRIVALPLQLSWDAFCFTVVVRELSLHYQNDRWIPYRVGCAVQQDETSLSIPAVVIGLASPWADINIAATESSAAGLTPDLPTAFNSSATVFGTESYYEVCSGLASADSVLKAGIAEREQSLYEANLTSSSPEDALQGLSEGSEAIRQLGLLIRARSYLGRATSNLRPENLVP